MRTKEGHSYIGRVRVIRDVAIELIDEGGLDLVETLDDGDYLMTLRLIRVEGESEMGKLQ